MSQPNGHHCSKAEKIRRVAQVYELVLRGKDTKTIRQAAAHLGWNVSDRTVDTYIAAARERIRRKAEADRPYDLGTARARLDLLWTEALSAQDLRTALAVQHEVNDLLGLPAPKRSDVQIAITDAMLDAEIAELEARLADGDG